MDQSTDQSARHRETVRLLGIFHFVYAGMIFVGSIFPIVWLTLLGLWWPELADEMSSGGGDLPVALTGSAIFLFAGVGILMTWVWAGFLIGAGRNLLAQRRHTYCLVVAAIACLSVPLGTLLGVATLVVLNREDTQALFER